MSKITRKCYFCDREASTSSLRYKKYCNLLWQADLCIFCWSVIDFNLDPPAGPLEVMLVEIVSCGMCPDYFTSWFCCACRGLGKVARWKSALHMLSEEA